MLARAIAVAVIVSAGWILLQNLLMHIRPVANRFGAMLLGYCLSLPFVFVLYRWMPPLTHGSAEAMQMESFGIGLFHAYCVHLPLFFQYVHCFYHVERSVTIRLFVELLAQGDKGLPIQALQSQYSLEEMIHQRLEVMRERGFVRQQGSSWRLNGKGIVLAFIARACSWLFQFKPQHERL